MKKVVFFFEPDWAFGSVHYELFKYLWPMGYNCHLLAWNKGYTVQEMQELDKQVDFWVTTPHGYRYLEYVYGAIPAERQVVIAHAPLDLNELNHYQGLGDFDRFRGYGVVSPFLKEYSAQLGIKREPIVCPVSINYHTYFSEPSESLKVVGYAGTYHEKSEFTEDMVNGELYQPKYRKRGYLVKEAAARAGLEFKVAQHYHNSFVTMSGFYKAVDSIVMSSSEEGAGLPVLEGGAAGKLVIGTPVGHWPERVGTKGGIEVPILEKEFLEATVDILMYYKDRPKEYREKCFEIQRHAQSYDWINYLPAWLNVLQ